jgi:hypothetical protein
MGIKITEEPLLLSIEVSKIALQQYKEGVVDTLAPTGCSAAPARSG